MNKGNLYIISAPSGAGKTSLVKQIISDLDSIVVSISHTTRAMRNTEIQGKDYFFISIEEFKQMIAEQAFLENAEVFGHFYGTAKQSVETALNNGVDVVLEIDWQGAQQIRKTFPDSVSIFVLPPSIDILQQRLEKRGQDSKAIIVRRMNDAINQMIHFKEFNYLVVNDHFEQAVSDMESIIISQRLVKSRQQKTLESFLKSLIKFD